MALQVENITKTYGTDVILDSVSLTASDNEKIGLIGANGAGKSTLLKIIAGDMVCDSGRILTPKDCTLGFLRQDASPEAHCTIGEYMMAAFGDLTAMEAELRAMEQKMAMDMDEEEHARLLRTYGERSEYFEKRGGFEIKTRIETVLTGMGLDKFDKAMLVDNLSGGEKTKLAMARLLTENPDVLLLDEPTNHLDFSTMQWLESYLKNYKGIIIAVSHDRYFLDSLADAIYEIEHHGIKRYTGNYSKYLVLKKQNEEIELKHYKARVEEAKKLEEYVAKNITRASTSKMAKSRQKMLDRLDVGEKPVVYNEACRFKFESVYRSYNDVITAENVSVSVPKSGILTTLAENINIDVKRGEKAAIIGANGAGKSTLLKTILGKHEFFDGDIEIGRNTSVSYYDQEQAQLTDSKTVFGEISDRFPLMDEVDIRTRLGSVLFKDEDVFKQIGDLSGGERARLLLLIIMMEKPNVLILDEPTNHLDLPAKEALDSAIADFEGTVLFVSHDRYFLNKTADIIYELTPTGTVSYRGNYDDYVKRVSTAQRDTSVSASDVSRGAMDYEAAKRYNAALRSLEKKIASSEELIAELEHKIKEADKKLENCGADFEEAARIYEEKAALESQLDSAYLAWSDYTEEKEKNF